MLLCDNITFTIAYSQISMEIILFVVNLSWNTLNVHAHIYTHIQTQICQMHTEKLKQIYNIYINIKKSNNKNILQNKSLCSIF